ncbi:hypothetical protein [Winogradskya humida]|uniref:Vegetative cell wall protein gp1 n=1 Tax=Winogradskya humida TaxID=113566 RepID=A0ABQ4A0V2_9ACTN|nr:hypothetical protein [Actinoplanes humidus]GIE24461.1 hypothetical protein Ahu01nite_075630 [Actinoplanes humidus]
MDSFLSAVGGRLADVWIRLLAIPGLILTGVAAVATALGHGHWADTGRLLDKATAAGTRISAGGSAGIVLTCVGVLLSAALAGVLARGGGLLVYELALGNWLVPSEWATKHRQARWADAANPYAEAVLANSARDVIDELAGRRNRIAPAEPSRPTWIGDRLASVDKLVWTEYKLDLVSAWPRLWLIMPDAARAELKEARAAFRAATTLAAWGLLYLLVGIAWWPAALIGVSVALTAWWRMRRDAATLADLAHAAVDLYGSSLARALGLAAEGDELTKELGARITARLRKGG